MSVKVVVAVGNRKIERCIARMEAIDVLTTVRKREAVLDAVINYNPHAVILSRELSGKTEMTDVIQRCRNLKECARLIKKQREVFGSGYRKKPQNMTRTAALRFRNTQKRSRANKNRIQPTGTPRTRNVSPGRFLFENLSFSQVKSRGK